MAICALWNFIRFHELDATQAEFDDFELVDKEVINQDDKIKIIPSFTAGKKWMLAKKEELAGEMWLEYQRYLAYKN